MATTEEFSFPTSTDLYPCSIDSPPLWRLSPAASPDVFLHSKGKQEEDCFPVSQRADEDDHQERKSKSHEDHNGWKQSDKGVAEDEDEDEEEKMDMLWEDFNEEELPRSGSSSRCSEDMVEMGCGGGHSLKLSKTNAGMFSQSPRRAGMLVFMRVLRKFFLLHNSHRSSNSHLPN
ncbi:hypothetical protein ERO13_A09G117400v2 [Gossypium hirsutum]|uniref:Uncharacterized protein n=5 Tax=Gossypium TaxID=3633 RepID=A0ABR0NUB3_GOSAR|nr:uncharacterized protein LOC107889369 [Gossypium hirsutum]XP_017609980.1 uncharacterized protein LOC108455914 [Gossypium arboreum]TYH02509.1 hypothetical protein ES288_A09G146300v1 [Gossypium darwinii]TYI10434.1 hypothetical protein ES332_A09G141100v1 [Gossypium tomentosum]TYJ18493.1 hypothetical protein E1A91_A09G127400v1 [Gossypium mustelinum]KAG4183576.1 hypothetical protein ERO13_A09G117400v2 [Gossypium hirsutum]KAK5803813.1 hypothetical protein PVK06_031462 [Gossypium arboreum]